MPKTRKKPWWSGWRGKSPNQKQRRAMRRRCGKKCFLGPNLSFPICAKGTCRRNKRGIMSAYIRAKQWGKPKSFYKNYWGKPRMKRKVYTRVAKKARKLMGWKKGGRRRRTKRRRRRITRKKRMRRGGHDTPLVLEIAPTDAQLAGWNTMIARLKIDILRNKINEIILTRGEWAIADDNDGGAQQDGHEPPDVFPIPVDDAWNDAFIARLQADILRNKINEIIRTRGEWTVDAPMSEATSNSSDSSDDDAAREGAEGLP